MATAVVEDRSRLSLFLNGTAVKCESLSCPSDAVRVIEWGPSNDRTREVVCARHGSQMVHPSRAHLRAVDVTNEA